MSKAEDYITQNTKTLEEYGKEYFKWLTPDQARRAVEIAREETIKEVCEWIEENIGEYCDGEDIMFSAMHIENIDIFEQEKFINDLKKHFESLEP